MKAIIACPARPVNQEDCCGRGEMRAPRDNHRPLGDRRVAHFMGLALHKGPARGSRPPSRGGTGPDARQGSGQVRATAATDRSGELPAPEVDRQDRDATRVPRRKHAGHLLVGA